MPETCWAFAERLSDHNERSAFHDLLIAWDAALRGPRIESCPPELAKAEIYVIEAVLGVPFDKAQGQRPKERRRK